MKKFLLAVFLTPFFLHAQDARTWATYYGSSGNENGFAVTTDDSGNVFMAGITNSTSGMASGGFQNSFGGGNVDAYLVKFSPSGARVWATYYGGTGDEMTFFGGKMGLATDDSGNVFLAGLTTSTSGIASANGFQNTIGGSINAYLVKFNAAGNRRWATYYGGTNGYGYDVSTDASGNVYLCGTTGSATGIASGGFQNTIGGQSDAFLVKFDRDGNRLWATYYGGSGADEGYNVATDLNGNVYLAGFTGSTSGIASGGFQTAYGGGGYDAFVVKFDPSGNRDWASYYGGSGDEMMLYAGDIGLAADPGGNVYLAGLTTSTSGIASGGFQNTFGGGSCDAFLVKFDITGQRTWGTYYGGSGDDKGYSVDVDASGYCFLTGRTSSASAIASGGFQNSFGGPEDLFLVKFDFSGTRLCSTYFGGTGMDNTNSVAVDNSGGVFVGGGTENTSGISYNGFQNFYGGGQFDAMLVKFTTTCVTAGIENFAMENSFSVFPNPSHDAVTIRQQEINSGLLEIFDATGKSVFVSDFHGEKTIDLSGFAKGIYLARLTGGDRCFTQKISVE